MALYLELPVYKACYELYLEFVKVRRTLPREERYTIGLELDESYCVRKLLIAKSRLPEIGSFSKDWQRFYPNTLE